MYNIFDNVKVFRDRTDTNEGQFRFRVEFSKSIGGGCRLITDKEFVIDTTEDRSECLAVALEMVREANREENRRYPPEG